MTLQQVFATIIFIISSLGLYGSRSLALIKAGHMGPGLMPVVYSSVLLLLSIALFIRGRKKEIVCIKKIVEEPAINGLIFFIILVIAVAVIKYVGIYISIAFLSVAVLIKQRKMKPLWIVIFTAVFVGLLYVVFPVLLNTPLERGIIFG